MQCFHRAGIPSGVLSLVTGKGSEIGDFLTQHPSVNCISFTGGDTGDGVWLAGSLGEYFWTRMSVALGEGRWGWSQWAGRVAVLLGCQQERGGADTGYRGHRAVGGRQDTTPSISYHPTGIAIARKAAMVPLQMELGGKDVCIVCDDADVALAAKHIVKGGFSYSGQVCCWVVEGRWGRGDEGGEMGEGR